MKINVSFRGGIEDDHSFILNSWLRSYYNTANINPVIPRKVFFKHEPDFIKYFLKEHYTMVAYDPNDRSHILGYCVYKPELDLLHYIYVKDSFRNLGIGKQLLEESFHRLKELNCSYWTPRLKRFKNNYYFNYNPYLKRVNYDL